MTTQLKKGSFFTQTTPKSKLKEIIKEALYVPESINKS